LPALAALLEQADELHREALPWLFRRIDVNQQIALRESCVSNSDHVAFLAVASDGTFAGALCAYLRPQSRSPIVQPATLAEIDVLVVKSSFRRQGVGKRLVQTALDWATASGASRTVLGVHEFNQPALAFWTSLGFQILSYRLVKHSDSAPTTSNRSTAFGVADEREGEGRRD